MKAVCFGEVLWDVFPEGKRIGGAPLNVALHLNNLGIDPLMISKIGNDSDGKEILNYLSEKNVSARGIQTDTEFPTGTVRVQLRNGIPTYAIVESVAWDKIERNEAIEKEVQEADFFVFGSLAARDAVSRETLIKLLDKAAYTVFDVNLRTPYYTYEGLDILLSKANFLKCNEEEMGEISTALGCQEVGLKAQMKFMSSKCGADTVCVTRGSEGAILYHQGTWFSHSGFTVKVDDTVGAGDSFLATLLVALHSGEAPQKALAKACAMGSLVASKAGANPTITHEELIEMMRQDL